ncbi:MAG: FAD-dependent oxidoreductase [Myxococcota bacterium]
MTVIGAGLGGLSAAIHAAHRGAEVTLLEAGPAPGGKAGVVEVEGIQIDTGPSLLTLPEIFEELWAMAPKPGTPRPELRVHGGHFLYRFHDGTSFRVHPEPAETLAEAERVFGATARNELCAYLEYAERIWTEAAPHFVMGQAPSMTSIMKLGVSGLSSVRHIDPMRTMWAAIKKQVQDPRLRWILARYATYNGSDVRKAPATLNCIAHVEMGIGGLGVQGGVQAVVHSLVDIARDLGVVIDYERPVRGLRRRGARVTGVETDDGPVEADAVVANCDANHVRRWVDIPKAKGEVPSMSALNLVIRARRRADRPAHQVLFPEAYLQEFEDIFDRDRHPVNPTVYMCAPEKAHGRTGWPEDEPLFVMANAPAEPKGQKRSPRIHEGLEARMLERLMAFEMIDSDDRVVWRRTPADLAARFPDTRGAIYGAASNGTWSAFQRPSNRVKGVRSLYLASGSAHPGGGMPLAVLSGKEAVRCLWEDVG